MNDLLDDEDFVEILSMNYRFMNRCVVDFTDLRGAADEVSIAMLDELAKNPYTTKLCIIRYKDFVKNSTMKIVRVDGILFHCVT